MKLKIIEIAGKLWSLESSFGVCYFTGTNKKLEKLLNLTIIGKGFTNKFEYDENIFKSWLIKYEKDLEFHKDNEKIK